MRLYAQGTTVPISRTRGKIDQLLRQWGCDAIQWSDDFAGGMVTLRFVWPHEDKKFCARISVRLPTQAELQEQAVDGRSGAPSSRKLEMLMETRGKREHRLLLLWLTASLNAVEAGVVSASTLFLPFLEDHNGRTVSEVAEGHLDRLLMGSAERLLPSGRV